MHKETGPDILEEIVKYPAPVVFGLIESPKEEQAWFPELNPTKSKLLRAYQRSYDYARDGIVVSEQKNGEVSFNGSAIPIIKQIEKGPMQGVRDLDDTQHEYLTRSQAESIKHPSTIKRRLGNLAVSAATTLSISSPIYTLTSSPVGAIMAGAATAGITYASATKLGKRHKTHEATKRWQEFGDWLMQPENGAITFSNKFSDHYELADITDSQVRTKIESLSGWVTRNSIAGLTVYGRSLLNIKIPPLIKSMLRDDHAPDELWYNSLGKTARDLAENENALAIKKQELADATARQKLTGIKVSGEIDNISDAIQELRGQRLDLTISAVEAFKTRHEKHVEERRQAEAVARINEIIKPDDSAEPWPLDWVFQDKIVGAAAKIIMEIDVTSKDSDEKVKAIESYLIKARKLLKDESQAKQFADGLIKRFGQPTSSLEQ